MLVELGLVEEDEPFASETRQILPMAWLRESSGPRRRGDWEGEAIMLELGVEGGAQLGGLLGRDARSYPN